MRQVKTIAVILGILGVGYALGFYSAGQYFKNKVKKMNKFMGGRHIDDVFFKEIALDESQADTIQTLMKEHKKIGKERWRAHYQASKANRDSLENNIRAILTEEQVIVFNKNVEEFHKKLREMRRRFRGPRPPHDRKNKKME